MGKIATVVVTYNRLDLLKECIEAIRSQSMKPDSIMVVNNGSTDGTEQWLHDQIDLQVITQGNTGGAGGFYTGIKSAIGKGDDFIWIMDDDTIPDPNCLSNLRAAFEAIPEISFAASLVESASGQKTNVPQIDNRKNKSTLYPDWSAYLEKGFMKIKETTFVSLLISAECVKKVGLPIKEFFIWGDDYEYTYRLSDFKPGYLAINSRAIHKSATGLPPVLARENDPQRIDWHYFAIRNKVYLFRKQRKGVRSWIGIARFFLSVFDLANKPHQGRKVKVFLKGFLSGLVFNPEIETVE